MSKAFLSCDENQVYLRSLVASSEQVAQDQRRLIKTVRTVFQMDCAGLINVSGTPRTVPAIAHGPASSS